MNAKLGWKFALATALVGIVLWICQMGLPWLAKHPDFDVAAGIPTWIQFLAPTGCVIVIQLLFRWVAWPKEGQLPEHAWHCVEAHYFLGFVATLLAIAISMYSGISEFTNPVAVLLPTDLSTSPEDAVRVTAAIAVPDQDNLQQFILKVSSNAGAAVLSTVFGFVLRLFARDTYFDKFGDESSSQEPDAMQQASTSSPRPPSGPEAPDSPQNSSARPVEDGCPCRHPQPVFECRYPAENLEPAPTDTTKEEASDDDRKPDAPSPDHSNQAAPAQPASEEQQTEPDSRMPFTSVPSPTIQRPPYRTPPLMGQDEIVNEVRAAIRRF